MRSYLEQVRESGADVLALGCTHYAFLGGMIEEEAGDGIVVIEPAAAVARQVGRGARCAAAAVGARPTGGRVLYLTSGDPAAFAASACAARRGRQRAFRRQQSRTFDGRRRMRDTGGLTFRAKLEAAWERSGSLLCIGLDPDPARMAVDDVAAFNIAIIEATSDLVCAYKPNLAFYEALGPGARLRRASQDARGDPDPHHHARRCEAGRCR